MPDLPKAPQFTIGLALLSTWVVWGSTYLGIRFALEGFKPFELMALRFLIAGGLLVAYCRWRGSRWPTLIEWRNSTIVGGLMLGGGIASAAIAEQSVSSGLVVTLISISPLVMTAMLIPFGQYPTKRELMGMCVSSIGVVGLAQGQGFHASPFGLMAVLFGCITWNLGSVLSRFKTPLMPGVMGYASEMLMGGLVLLALSGITHESWVWPHSPRAIWALIYLIIFGSWIAFNAYMYLLERTPPALTLSYTYINPVIGLGLGVWLAAETLTLQEAVAAFIILIGLIIAITGRHSRK